MRAQFHAEAKDPAGARFIADVAEGHIQPATAAYYDKRISRLSRNIMPSLPT
jgi:hypothetical protein